jgi:hypothetical protein
MVSYPTLHLLRLSARRKVPGPDAALAIRLLERIVRSSASSPKRFPGPKASPPAPGSSDTLAPPTKLLLSSSEERPEGPFGSEATRPTRYDSGVRASASVPLQYPQKTASVWRLSVRSSGGPGRGAPLIFVLYFRIEETTVSPQDLFCYYGADEVCVVWRSWW